MLLKTVKITSKVDSFFPSTFFSMASKDVNGDFTVLQSLTSCRGWMGDALLKLKFPNIKYTPNFKLPKYYNYHSGNTYVAIGMKNKNDLETFLINLPILHEKEKKARLKRTEIFKTGTENLYIIQGSKYWKDSCWKIMLYTFYLKTLVYKNPKLCDTIYWESLGDGKEDKLLSHIKIQREIFDTKTVYNQNGPFGRGGAHEKEGFVSICKGLNPPMAKLLGVDY